MKNLTKILPVLLLFIFVAGIQDAVAQRSGKKKKKKDTTDEYFDDKGSFASRLWYGGGVNLGLSNGYFEFGLTPMVGYKFTDALSIGPRGRMLFQHYKLSDGQTNYNLRTFSYGMGIFGRAKVFNNFFAHVEYEHEREGQPLYDDFGNFVINPDKPNSLRSTTVPHIQYWSGL